MDMTNAAQLIGALGFPIFACCAMFWAFIKFIPKFIEALNNNTTAMLKIAERIDSKINE